MENKLLLPGLFPTGSPRGENQRQHFTWKFSVNDLFSTKCNFRAVEIICQCRSSPLDSLHHYEKWLLPPKYQNEDVCLLNPSFYCSNHFQKLLTKDKRTRCKKKMSRAHVQYFFFFFLNLKFWYLFSL